MYPIPAPTECAPTGMSRQAGGPPRAACNEEGHWEQLGSRRPVEGQGEAGGFLNLGCLGRSSSLPHSTPETAEFLGEDLQQVRAWAGRGWQDRPAQAVSRGPHEDAIWGGPFQSFPQAVGRGVSSRREEKGGSWSGKEQGSGGVGDNHLS